MTVRYLLEFIQSAQAPSHSVSFSIKFIVIPPVF